MQAMNYMTTQENYSTFNFTNVMQANLPTMLPYTTTFLENYPIALPVQEFSPNATCISNSSTSDEAYISDHQPNIIDERKKRRMISNRESARRSRMRKQKHFDELWSQVARFQKENQSLIDKLSHMSESYDKVIQENVCLKEENSDLRRMVVDLQMSDSCNFFTDLEDIPSNAANYFRAESSSLSNSSSANLLD